MRAYSYSALSDVLRANRAGWQLPSGTSASKFIGFLLERTRLKRPELKHTSFHAPSLYVWDDASPYEIALTIRPRSYLSHQTAAFLHSLIPREPSTIYANQEQREKPNPQTAPTQEAIDRAFLLPQRQSRYILSYGNWRIVLLSGKHTDQLGVQPLVGAAKEPLRAAGIERTLIDTAVRPAYISGPQSTLDVYRTARGRVSATVLLQILMKLDYAYPYHQAIGFYMERAGFHPSDYDQFRKPGLIYDFYLAHGMDNKDYDRDWRLFYPKELA